MNFYEKMQLKYYKFFVDFFHFYKMVRLEMFEVNRFLLWFEMEMEYMKDN